MTRMKMKKRRVVWDNAEKELLFAALLKRGVSPYSQILAREFDLIQINLLPKERHRVIKFESNLRDTRDEYRVFTGDTFPPPPPPPVKVVEVVPEPEVVEAPVAKTEIAVIPTEVTALQVKTSDASLGSFLSAFDLAYKEAKNLASHLVEENAKLKEEISDLRTYISEQVGFLMEYVGSETKPQMKETVSSVTKSETHTVSVVEQVTEQTVEPVQPEMALSPVDECTVSKKKVVVLGTFPNVKNRLESEFSEKFKLVCIERPDKSTKAHIDNADHILLMSGFCRHSTQEMLRAHANKRFVLVKGGMSSVKRKLLELRV